MWNSIPVFICIMYFCVYLHLFLDFSFFAVVRSFLPLCHLASCWSCTWRMFIFHIINRYSATFTEFCYCLQFFSWFIETSTQSKYTIVSPANYKHSLTSPFWLFMLLISFSSTAWVWAGSGSWWWTGKPGVLQSMGSQSRTRLSDWTELSIAWAMVHLK